MKILGCDLSTKCSGLATISSSGKLLYHTHVDLHKIKDTEQRIDSMILAVDEFFMSEKPDVCYVEDSWGGGSFSNTATTKKLTNIIGAVRHMCLQSGCTFHTIMPSSWRSTLKLDGGKNTKRDAFKQRAIEYIKNKYHIDVQEDEAEACCIATAAYLREIDDDSLFE